MTSLATRREISLSALAYAAIAPRALAAGDDDGPPLKVARIGGGVGLHYVEAGRGAPIVFVHGSLSDLNYWSDQIGPFSAHGRAIAYSRRYNYPNTNAAIAGYSAIVDAADLGRLIEALRLGPCHIVGHSYGALTALFLAARRPDLVRTLSLAEPPAMPLLDHVPEPNAAAGRAMLADVNARMVAPMKAAFSAGRREAGVRIFIDYVFGKPGTWDGFTALDKTKTLCDAAEWDVMLPAGTLFPPIAPAAVRAIRKPVLMLSGAKSYPFLGLIDQALLALLPDRRRIVFPDVGHQMWLRYPRECRAAVLALITASGRARG